MLENPMFNDYGWGYNNNDDDGVVCSCDNCCTDLYANEIVYYDSGTNQVYCQDCYSEILSELEGEELEQFLDEVYALYGWELVN